MTKPALKREMIDYVGMRRVFLETKDTRLFEHPYGPRYPDAVGMIFRKRWVSGPDLSDTDKAIVKEIRPNIFPDLSPNKKLKNNLA